MRQSIFVTIFVTLSSFLSITAEAKIECTNYPLQDSVAYRICNRVPSWNKSVTIDFVKVIGPQNEEFYHIRGIFYGINLKNKIGETAYLVVDNDLYPLKPVPFNPYAAPEDDHKHFPMGDYVIPVDIAKKIKDFKSTVGFQFFVEGYKPRIMTFSKSENEEIRYMITLNKEDISRAHNRLLFVPK